MIRLSAAKNCMGAWGDDRPHAMASSRSLSEVVSLVSFEESTGASEDKNDDIALGNRETQAVVRLRSVTLGVMFLAGVVVCCSFFFVTKRGEHSKFVSEFTASARKLQQAFAEGIVKQNTQSLVTLSSFITAHSIETNEIWPFVTIPSFRQHAEDLMDLTGMMQLAFYPLLGNAEEAERWRRYSTNHTAWLLESLQNQRSDQILEDFDILAMIVPDSYDPQIDFSSGISNFVFTYSRSGEAIPDPMALPDGMRENTVSGSNGIPQSNTADQGKGGPFTPVWQVAPVPPVPLVNYNLLRHPEFGFGIRASIALENIVIGGFEVSEAGGIDSSVVETRLFSSMLSHSKQELVEYDGSPLSSIYVPVFDSFDNENRTLVGIISGSFKWDNYFENLLLQTLGELTVVIENTCEGSATFSVNGPKVEFVGMGDHHQQRYSEMEESISFENLVGNDQGRIGMGEAWCVYIIHVYPTKEFEATVKTTTPTVLTVAVALIFVFTISMFIFFNFIVEYRQNLVLTTAEKSNAIVSSMFPRAIQDRLLNEQEVPLASKGFFSDKRRMNSFLAGPSHHCPVW